MFDDASVITREMLFSVRDEKTRGRLGQRRGKLNEERFIKAWDIPADLRESHFKWLVSVEPATKQQDYHEATDALIYTHIRSLEIIHVQIKSSLGVAKLFRDTHPDYLTIVIKDGFQKHHILYATFVEMMKVFPKSKPHLLVNGRWPNIVTKK